MNSKDVDRMADSVDSDRTASLLAQAYLCENLGS